jgi:hypothetical protein
MLRLQWKQKRPDLRHRSRRQDGWPNLGRLVQLRLCQRRNLLRHQHQRERLVLPQPPNCKGTRSMARLRNLSSQWWLAWSRDGRVPFLTLLR